MSFHLFPVEKYIMIFSEVVGSQDPLFPVHANRLLHQARTERLMCFRSLAGVCRAWLDPARTVFWAEVTLLIVPELVAFARAVEDASAKPACIRRLYFHSPSYMYSPPDSATVVNEAQSSALIALRRLPVHLDVLHINCNRNLNEILYHSLQAAYQDRVWTVNVTKLEIRSRPGACDVPSHFAFACNVTDLVLTVTSGGGERTFKTPISYMQLQSLSINLKFDGGFFYRFMGLAASRATRALRPACTTLQSLTLNLWGYDSTSESMRVEATKHVLSLNGPSTSVLNLCAKPEFAFIPLARELADARVFPPCPLLLRLHLDGFGVSSDIFRQMGCSELRQLEVTVMEKAIPSALDGVETMKDILTSLELNELDNLQDLFVNFGSVEIYKRDVPTVRSWVGTEQAWKPLEMACAARNMTCIIRHPE